MVILGVRTEVVISGICREAAPAPYLLHSVVRFALSTCPTALGFRLWLQNVSTLAHWLLDICSLDWNFEHRQRNILWVERYTLYMYSYARQFLMEKVCCAISTTCHQDNFTGVRVKRGAWFECSCFMIPPCDPKYSRQTGGTILLWCPVVSGISYHWYDISKLYNRRQVEGWPYSASSLV